MKERENEDQEILEQAKTTLLEAMTWSDELPDQFMIANPAYQNYKFRTNWFQKVISSLLMIAEILGDTEFAKEIHAFAAQLREKKTRDRMVRTTREEIEKVDAMIRRALSMLQ